MMSFGLRWRLAQSATSFGRQVAAGLMVTAIGSAFFPFGARGPAAAPPEPKVTMRVEPAPETPPATQPLLQDARFESAPEPRAVKPTATHKPKPLVAVLPPPRPRETIEAEAPTPTAATEPDPNWLANTRAALGMTPSAFEAAPSALATTRYWAVEGPLWAAHAALGAVTTLGQAAHLAW